MGCRVSIPPGASHPIVQACNLLQPPQSARLGGGIAIATETGPPLKARVDALRDAEPDPFRGEPEAVEAYVIQARGLLGLLASDGVGLSDSQARYLRQAAARQVRFAHARLENDRSAGVEILTRLFRLGTVPTPDGHFEGELLGLSTGLLSDPFFEWLSRLYLPWQGKTFDAAACTGDNVFTDNAWSRATGRLGWPEYRIASDDLPGLVRVFPFRSYPANGIEDPETRVLKMDYSDSQNPLPVRRMVDEIVELPGGYLLGKAHMRGLRRMRRVCFFGLCRVGEGALPSPDSGRP